MEDNIEEELNIETNDEITPQSISGDKSYEFEYDEQAVFKRLSTDIYESRKAGVREPVANAVTAIHEAVENDYITQQEGTLRVVVKEESEMTKLVIEDNGIGISEERLRKVQSTIGNSTSISRSTHAGQFGMGFLAMFQLVGTDGGFSMYTRSRRTDETIAGYWQNGGFEEFEVMEQDYNQYGTRFVMNVQSEISTHDICEWVKKNTKFARTNVLYEYQDENGNVISDDEWSADYSFEDDIDSSVYYKYEDEYVEAVASRDAEDRCILLDVPVGSSKVGLSGKFDSTVSYCDVRLKHENGVVVDGVHEGRTVVEQDSDQVERNALEGDTPVTPTPVGTRDSLEENNTFWNWLEQRMKDEIESYIQNILTTHTSVSELSEQQEAFAKIAARRTSGGYYTDYTYSERVDKLVGNHGATCQLAEELLVKEMTIHRVHGNQRNPTLKSSMSSVSVENARIGADDYIGVTINERRLEKATENGEMVYKVPSSDYYEPLQRMTDCSLLRNVEIMRKTSNNTVTLHKNGDSEKMLFDEFTSKLGDWETVLVFTPQMKYKISDYTYNSYLNSYPMVKTRRWDEIKQYESAIRFSNWVEQQKEKTVRTANGLKTVRSLVEYDDVDLLLFEDDDTRQKFTDFDLSSEFGGDVQFIITEDDVDHLDDAVALFSELSFWSESYRGRGRRFKPMKAYFRLKTAELDDNIEKKVKEAFDVDKNADIKTIEQAIELIDDSV